MARTLFDKVWDAHVVKELPEGGTLLFIDRHLVHEVTSPQAFDGLRERGRSVRRPDLTFATVDHNVPTDGRPIDEETLLDAATLAAHFSSHRTEAQVDVSYVAKKFVRKPPKSRPGLVTHSGAKTVRIRLEPARIERLLASESR